MRKTTHLWFGALCGILAAKGLNDVGITTDILSQAVVVAGTTVGALIPDIDHPQSFLGRKFAIISRPTAAFARFCARKNWGGLQKSFSHRGVFHAPLLYSLLGMLSWFLIPAGLIQMGVTALCFGCLSHILADMFNPSGIAIAQPFCWKRISFAKITTGTGKELVFRFGTILLCGIAAAWSFGWLNGLKTILK